MEEIRLVAGLGNPGREYDRTRHNIGFLVVDLLSRRAGTEFSHQPKWNADVARAGDLVLMKPRTFMNLSGEAVGDYCRFFKLEPEQTLVVIDDVALPLGRLRIRKAGSAGGHNGLASVLAHLGTERVPRLRIGIGGAKDSLVGHVLGKFSSDEEKALEAAVARAADAVEFSHTHGLEAAMNQFNQPTELT